MPDDLNARGQAMTPLEWILNGDTGTSSKTIWAAFMDVPFDDADIPYDPDDFSRCYDLLKTFPEWRSHLRVVAEKYPWWTPFVREWGRLERMYKRKYASLDHEISLLEVESHRLRYPGVEIRTDKRGHLTYMDTLPDAEGRA